MSSWGPQRGTQVDEEASSSWFLSLGSWAMEPRAVMLVLGRIHSPEPVSSPNMEA